MRSRSITLPLVLVSSLRVSFSCIGWLLRFSDGRYLRLRSVLVNRTKVPVGRGGSSAQSGWREGPCPKGAGGLSPGFQPWEPRPERFALKGRQIERTNNAKVGPIAARLNCVTLIFGAAIDPGFIWLASRPFSRLF